MYINLKDNIYLREEVIDGIYFDRRVDHALDSINRVPLRDFRILQLFRNSFSTLDLVSILEKSGYCSDCLPESFLKYMQEKYSDIIEISPCKRNNLECDPVNNLLELFSRTDLEQKLAYPIMVSLRVCNYCDSYCIYCFNQSNRTNKIHLEADLINKLLIELRNGGATTINITGGDPLCHPDILKIIKWMNELNFFYSISTKRIINKDFAKDLAFVGLSNLQLSIDSSDDTINGMLVGKKDYFEQQKRSIKELISNNIKITVNTVLNAYNISNIFQFMDEMDALKVDKVTITPYLHGRGRNDGLMPNEVVVQEFKEKLHVWKQKSLLEVEFAVPEQDISYSYYKGKHPMCSGGRMSLVVDCNGDVTICERLVGDSRFVVGNIKDQSIIDVWNSEKLRFLTHPNKDFFKETKCWNCEFFSSCVTSSGVCYARICETSRKMYDVDPFCENSNKKMRFH